MLLGGEKFLARYETRDKKSQGSFHDGDCRTHTAGGAIGKGVRIITSTSIVEKFNWLVRKKGLTVLGR